ncbi:MAG: hypothetical protein K0R39_5119 [Symbiobacteriaceae bacterium]|jgi:spore germination protein KB|nr:hypothetical protein [Symbiobacteriaceae bacterium]
MAKISARQFGMLVFLLRISLTIVRLPVLKAVKVGPDAWIASLLGTAVGLVALWLLISLFLREPSLTPMERVDRALGKVAGGLLGTLYLIFIFWDLMLTTRLYAGLLISQPMPETPTEAFVFMLLLGAVYAAHKGPEVVARVGEFIAPLILLSTVIVLPLGANNMNLSALTPVLGYGWGQVLRAALFPATVHVEIIALLALTPMVRDPKNMLRTGMIGGLLAGLIAAVASACLIMFYGVPRTQRLVYPLYDLTRSVTFGDFFERIDALFIFTWTASSFVKVALLIWISSFVLGHVLRIKNSRVLIRPLALLAGFLAMRAYANQAEVRALTSPQIYPFVALPFLVLFPLVLQVAEWIRRPRGKAS